jgi:hypothetical protein
MFNPSSIDEKVVSTLREVELPPAPPDLAFRMLMPMPRRRGMTWLAASGVATVVGALVLGTAMHPTVSLAQVAAAQSGQLEYVVTETNGVGTGAPWTITTSRDGNRWSVLFSSIGPKRTPAKKEIQSAFARLIMDGTRTVQIISNPSLLDVVELDDPKPIPDDYRFDIKRLLRSDSKLKTILGTKWHGQKVDRFEAKGTYRDSGKTQTIEQLVIADAVTHLPIHSEEFRDSHSWGSVTDYEYRHPPENVFEYKISPKAKVFDLHKQRAEFVAGLTTGALFLDYRRQATILFPATSKANRIFCPVKFNESPRTLQALLFTERKLGPMRAWTSTINGRRWETATLQGLSYGEIKTFGPFQGDKVSLTIGNTKLDSIPIFHVYDAHQILEPFLEKLNVSS